MTRSRHVRRLTREAHRQIWNIATTQGEATNHAAHTAFIDDADRDVMASNRRIRRRAHGCRIAVHPAGRGRDGGDRSTGWRRSPSPRTRPRPFPRAVRPPSSPSPCLPTPHARETPPPTATTSTAIWSRKGPTSPPSTSWARRRPATASSNTLGIYYGAVNTAVTTGQIVGIPTDFEWGPLVSIDTVPLARSCTPVGTTGAWEAGIACANTNGALSDNWNTPITFTAELGRSQRLHLVGVRHRWRTTADHNDNDDHRPDDRIHHHRRRTTTGSTDRPAPGRAPTSTTVAAGGPPHGRDTIGTGRVSDPAATSTPAATASGRAGLHRHSRPQVPGRRPARDRPRADPARLGLPLAARPSGSGDPNGDHHPDRARAGAAPGPGARERTRRRVVARRRGSASTGTGGAPSGRWTRSRPPAVGLQVRSALIDGGHPHHRSGGAAGLGEHPRAPFGSDLHVQPVPYRAGPGHGSARGQRANSAGPGHPDRTDHHPVDRRQTGGRRGHHRVGAGHGPGSPAVHGLPRRGRDQRHPRAGRRLRGPVRPHRRSSTMGSSITVTTQVGSRCSGWSVSAMPAASRSRSAAASAVLILGTASGASYVPSGVVSVYADKIGAPLAADHPPVHTVPASQRPLGTDTSNLWALLLWLGALAAVLAGAVWTWHRRGHAQAWIVFAAPLALVWFFVADQIANCSPISCDADNRHRFQGTDHMLLNETDAHPSSSGWPICNAVHPRGP